ncbi:MAG: amylo-alpha-1,6-glucosidase [Candidatus Gastranaerophilaceae bacterium]|jgi:glycogen debranching enzyme
MKNNIVSSSPFLPLNITKNSRQKTSDSIIPNSDLHVSNLPNYKECGCYRPITFGNSNNKSYAAEMVQKLKLSPEQKMLLTGLEERVGTERFKIGASIRNGWLASIITNPYFNKEDIENAVTRTCKSQFMGEIIKHDNLFMNAAADGNIYEEMNAGEGESKALGLFSDDTDFVDNYEVAIKDGDKKLKLEVDSKKNNGYSTQYKLSGNCVTLERNQVINKGFYESFKVKNNSARDKTVSIDLSAHIKDIFETRFHTKNCIGNNFTCQPIEKDGKIEGYILNTDVSPDRKMGIKVLVKVVEDKDSESVNFNVENNNLKAKINIPAGKTKEVLVNIQPILNNKPYVNGTTIEENSLPASFEQAIKDVQEKKSAGFSRISIKGSGLMQNAGKVVQQNLQDLEMLTNILSVEGKDHKYIPAGLPRYACLFGRDSIITSKEILPLNPDIAKGTIELLSEYQGKTFEEAKTKDPGLTRERYLQKEEEEGKIPHELRVGELSRQKKICFDPYYGTVDATPLWLSLISDYYKWTGDKETVSKLIKTGKIQKALDWIDKNSTSESKYLIIKGGENDFMKNQGKIKNQGWKDSGDSLKHELNEKRKIKDPTYPVALAEVQGYVYKAKKEIVQVYRDFKMESEAKKLDKEAEELKKNFNRDFWVEENNFIASGLDIGAGSTPVKSVSTNGAQCLATGIVDPDKAQKMEQIIMDPEMMNSGWGIRTLSKMRNKEKNEPEYAYDPMSYHNGSVWPHDSALVAAGLSHKNNAKIAANLIEAAKKFGGRIPELYAGFEKKDGDKDIQSYPEGCSPQAWSAASLPYGIISSLGLKPDIKNKTLIFENPEIPDNMEEIAIENLNYAGKKISLLVKKDKENGLNIQAKDMETAGIYETVKSGNTYKIGIA